MVPDGTAAGTVAFNVAAPALSVVLIRPGNPVFAVLEPRVEGRPYLVGNARFGLCVYGRFKDPVLQPRFAEACKMAYGREGKENLEFARLRAVAHVLRRAMRERHDGDPVQLYEEGEP